MSRGQLSDEPPRPPATRIARRDRVRRAFPLADPITYAISAGSLAAVFVLSDLLDRVAAHLGGLP